MNVLIVGLGKTGSFLSADLAEKGAHRLTAVESDEERAAAVERVTGIRVITGDGCEPSILEEAGVRNTDLVVAATGDDEDNLVIAQLARFHFNAGRVIARVNNPRNHWLYTREWGVDVAVSPTHIITKLIEEEMSLGDLITLLKLKGGEVALTEIKLSSSSRAAGKLVSELGLPRESLLVAVMRGEEVFFPGGDTRLAEDDELLAVTPVAMEQELLKALD